MSDYSPVKQDVSTYKAIAWTCHAISAVAREENGRHVVIAECSGLGRRSENCERDAALIARALNVRDELVKALQAFLSLDPTFTSTCDAHLAELVEAQQPLALAVSMARTALAKAGAA